MIWNSLTLKSTSQTIFCSWETNKRLKLQSLKVLFSCWQTCFSWEGEGGWWFWQQGRWQRDHIRNKQKHRTRSPNQIEPDSVCVGIGWVWHEFIFDWFNLWTRSGPDSMNGTCNEFSFTNQSNTHTHLKPHVHRCLSTRTGGISWK